MDGFRRTSRSRDADELDPKSPSPLRCSPPWLHGRAASKACDQPQRIGVVPARAPAANGIRSDDFPPAPLHRLLCYVKGGSFSGRSAESRPDYIFTSFAKHIILFTSLNPILKWNA